MNKTGWFFTSFSVWLIGFMLLSVVDHPTTPTPPQIIPPPISPTPQPPARPLEPDCIGVQVPIPKDCRVFNKSGSQCVWCSIECLGRYLGVKDLYEGDKRLTLHYTWATGPNEVQRVLSSKYPKVKWKQVQNQRELVPFIKRYVCEKKFGVAIGIPGHMLNLVHYDERTEIVKVIDNYGPQALKIQDWSMDEFNDNSEGWALTVFPPDYIETAADEAFNCTLTDPFKLHGRQ